MTDWKVGDLAVCVDTLPRKVCAGGDGCKKGRIYRVEAVVNDWLGNIGLVLEGRRSDHPTGGYLAIAFRKIRPDAHEDCEPEFVTLLKRSKVAA